VDLVGADGIAQLLGNEWSSGNTIHTNSSENNQVELGEHPLRSADTLNQETSGYGLYSSVSKAPKPR